MRVAVDGMLSRNRGYSIIGNLRHKYKFAFVLICHGQRIACFTVNIL